MSAVFCLVSCSDKDLLGFMFTEREIITAHPNFDRVAQWCKTDEFDRRSDKQPHFHQARPAFRRKFYFGDRCSCAQRDRRQRLKI